MRCLAGEYKITEEKKSFFLEAYALDPETSFLRQTAIHTSTSEKYILWQQNLPVYFLKQVPSYADRVDQILVRANLLRHLQACHVSVPELIWKSSDPYVLFKDKKWQLFRYVQGDPSPRDQEAKMHGLKLLEEYHRHARQFYFRKILSLELDSYLFRQIFNLLHLLNCEKRLSLDLCSLVLSLYQRISQLLDRTEREIYYVHGDFSLNNILFQGSKVACLVDFDNIALNRLERDLSEYLLTTYCFTYRKHSTHFTSTLPPLLSSSQALHILKEHPKLLSQINETLLSCYLVCVYCELVLLGFLRQDFRLSRANVRVFNSEIKEFLA